ALPNAIREALPTNGPGRVDAGTTLLMAALSMPDLAARREVPQPVRVGCDRVAIGQSTLSVQSAQDTEELSVSIQGWPDPDNAHARKPVETFDLANFVGQVMILRACG